jgi:hypothetical protein
MTVLMLQQPVPPVPPVPHQEVTLGGSLEGWEAIILLVVLLTTIAALLWPVIKAIARRIEAGGAAADARGELEELRERVRQLEQANPRLAELEERLDFAERVLAQQEPDRLKR